MNKKVYLNTWFICLMFALWPMGFPPLIGLYLLFKQSKYNSELRKKYGDIDQLETEINRRKNEAADIINQANKTGESIISKSKEDLEKLNDKIGHLNAKLSELQNTKKDLEVELNSLNMQLSNLDKQFTLKVVNISDYDHITSEECKNELALLKIEENELVKTDNALIVTSTDSKKVLNNNIKQILRSFNSECNNVLINLTVKNVETSRNKIMKSFETLNSIFSTDGVKIANELLEIKLKELNLNYAYQLKKEQERDQQKAIKEQMLEEEKVRREIEAEKKKIEKEETQFKNEVNKLMSYLNKAQSDIDRNLYIDKIKELEEKLKLLEKDKENVLQREQNTRAGFVYVISNIGSFGQDVYKIGMTRRLEPMDRIKELSSASVPFDFDVHAMIFSEDAPALETTLHNTFRSKEVNKVNPRKEFFRVPLKEIESVVKENHNATVEFTLVAEATQFRESVRLANKGIA